MAQIQAGHTYTSTGANSLVTASNLNQHVNNAQLSSGAIAEQTANSATADTDLLLIGKAGSLFKQTKLQFTDTINSQTINVNGLSVDSADIDTLAISSTLDGPNARLFDVGYAIIHSNESDGVRIGYNGAYFTSRPAGVVDLNQFSVTAKNFTFANTNLSGVALAKIDAGDLHVNELGGVGGNIDVDGNATIHGNVVIDGTLTVAGGGPTLKASGSWRFDGTNLVPRRAPFNCSATRIATGYYRIDFTTPMSSPDYVISAVSTQWDGNASVSMGEYGTRTSSLFYVLAQYRIFSSSGGPTDVDFDVLVFD
jgi:hypothetical protein